DRVGTHDPFFELGGNSLLSVRMLTRLREETGRDISLASFFRYPTIAGLAESMWEGEAPAEPRAYSSAGASPSRQEPRLPPLPAASGVAIVGMAGRFPGASNIDQLWRNL